MQKFSESWGYLSDVQKEDCLLGRKLYNRLTQGEQRALTIEEARILSNDELRCVVLFSIGFKLDCESDRILDETVDYCLKVLAERGYPQTAAERQ